MRKFTLYTLAILMAGFLLPGCVYTDMVGEPLAGDPLLCAGTCDDQAGALLESAVMGTTGGPGTAGFFFPKEPGEYWNNIQFLEGEQAGCTRWAGGGGLDARMDTYRNEAAHASGNGCPNNTICGWLGATAFNNPLGYNFSVCEQAYPVTPTPINFCNLGNGLCAGPLFGGGPFTPIAANTYATELAYLVIDEDTSGATQFGQNIRREIGQPCADPCTGGVAPVPLNIPAGSVAICHIPPGNPDNAHTIVVSQSAVPAHEAHGDDVGGPCSGGGGGQANEVQGPDVQPAWVLALGYLADFGIQPLAGSLPWTDDYSGGGVANERAAAELYDVLSRFPVDSAGLSTIPVSRLVGATESVTLSSPLDLQIKMDPLAGDYRFAVDITSPGLPEVVHFILDNTADGKAIDLTSLAFELTDGSKLRGATIAKVFPFELALQHERLYKVLDYLEAGAPDSGNLDSARPGARGTFSR